MWRQGPRLFLKANNKKKLMFYKRGEIVDNKDIQLSVMVGSTGVTTI